MPEPPLGAARRSRTFVGVDIASGRGRDLFVVWVLEQVGDVLWTREVIASNTIGPLQQPEVLADVFKRYRVLRACMDQTGMGETPVALAQRRHGASRVEGVLFTSPNKLQLATLGKTRFEDRRIRIAATPEVRADLHKLQKVAGPTGTPRFVADADGSASTNALGKIHNEVRKDLRDSDIRQLNSTLSRDLVYAIAAVNGLAPGGPRRAPVFQLNTQEQEDLTAYAQALPALVAIGLRPTVKWAHEKLGIPQAQEGEAVLGAGPSSLPSPLGEGGGGGLPGPQPQAALSAQPLPDAPPQRMAAQLATSQEPHVGVWLGHIRALVDRADSLQDIRDGLQALLPDMGLDDYAQAMAQALACAQLAGRYEVLREAAGHG